MSRTCSDEIFWCDPSPEPRFAFLVDFTGLTRTWSEVAEQFRRMAEEITGAAGLQLKCLEMPKLTIFNDEIRGFDGRGGTDPHGNDARPRMDGSGGVARQPHPYGTCAHGKVRARCRRC